MAGRPVTTAPRADDGADLVVEPHRATVAVGWHTAVVLVIATLAGLGTLLWPLFVPPGGGVVDAAGGTPSAPVLFVVLLPVVVLVTLAQLTDRRMDARALALLGVLSAVDAALRPLGSGVAGFELVFFLLVLAGRVFGAGFGFVLGCTSLFASALLTGGVGPWLPFQMLGAAWIGLGAGLLPGRVRGRWEIAMLVGYGVLVAYAYGALMNFTTWPFLAGVTLPGVSSPVAFVPGAAVSQNLQHFAVYSVVSSVTWDTGRAVTNAVAIAVVGPAVLATLRRVAVRATFVGD